MAIEKPNWNSIFGTIDFTVFSDEQLYEIKIGIGYDLPVHLYADPNLSAQKMKEMRYMLETALYAVENPLERIACTEYGPDDLSPGFKSEANFAKHPNWVCYVPEQWDFEKKGPGYSGKDILTLCGGDSLKARRVFDRCEGLDIPDILKEIERERYRDLSIFRGTSAIAAKSDVAFVDLDDNKDHITVADFLDNLFNAVEETFLTGEYGSWEDFCTVVPFQLQGGAPSGYKLTVWGEEQDVERGESTSEDAKYYSVSVYPAAHEGDPKYILAQAHTSNISYDALTDTVMHVISQVQKDVLQKASPCSCLDRLLKQTSWHELKPFMPDVHQDTAALASLVNMGRQVEQGGLPQYSKAWQNVMFSSLCAFAKKQNPYRTEDNTNLDTACYFFRQMFYLDQNNIQYGEHFSKAFQTAKAYFFEVCEQKAQALCERLDQKLAETKEQRDYVQHVDLTQRIKQAEQSKKAQCASISCHMPHKEEDAPVL